VPTREHRRQDEGQRRAPAHHDTADLIDDVFAA
jgi:hypothetical protein